MNDRMNEVSGDIFLNTTNGALSDVKMTLVPAGVGVGVDGSPLETLQEVPFHQLTLLKNTTRLKKQH